MQTTLIRGTAGVLDWGLTPSADLGASERLLKAVAAKPSIGKIIRVYRPNPTVAFSGLEQRLEGFTNAVGEARAFGFEPVIRPAGGRMVALDEQWLVLDVITPEPARRIMHSDVYRFYGDAFVELLASLGVQANFGPVEGEYCPGEYSVNARESVKLVGTAQRVVRGARLFSACIPFEVSFNVAELFSRVNQQLGLEWRPSTLGSVHEEAPLLTIDQLEAKLLETFASEITRTATLTDVFIKGARPELLAPNRELARV
jgi:lipoate-protein ligase A